MKTEKLLNATPSYKTIGRAVNMSQNTVRKYVAELVNKNLIATEPTKIHTMSGKIRNGTLEYTILPIQQAIDYFHQKQLDM